MLHALAPHEVLSQAAWLVQVAEPIEHLEIIAKRFEDRLTELNANPDTFDPFEIKPGVKLPVVQTSSAVVRWMKGIDEKDTRSIKLLGRLHATVKLAIQSRTATENNT